jgi:tryptophan synthase alpha chain
MPSSLLTGAVAAAKKQGRLATIPFLTAGFPSLNGFWTILEELSLAGADIIEIGLPFSDPVADGPVVAAASQKALEAGANLSYLLEGLTKLNLKTPLVLMSYANPLIQYGWFRGPKSLSPREMINQSLKELAADLSKAGISGVIVADLPLEESGPFFKAFKATELDFIPLVCPNTSVERMTQYKAVAGGYIYVVSLLGTTGVRDGLAPEAVKTIKMAREVFDLPLALGFGLKEPSQLSALGGVLPEAVIFGSALLKHISVGAPVRDFLKPWLYC